MGVPQLPELGDPPVHPVSQMLLLRFQRGARVAQPLPRSAHAQLLRLLDRLRLLERPLGAVDLSQEVLLLREHAAPRLDLLHRQLAPQLGIAGPELLVEDGVNEGPNPLSVALRRRCSRSESRSPSAAARSEALRASCASPITASAAAWLA